MELGPAKVETVVPTASVVKEDREPNMGRSGHTQHKIRLDSSCPMCGDAYMHAMHAKHHETEAKVQKQNNNVVSSHHLSHQCPKAEPHFRPRSFLEAHCAPESSLSSSYFKLLPPLPLSSDHRSYLLPRSRSKMKLSVDSLLSSLKRSSSSKNEKKKSRRSVARADASFASNSSFSASSSSEEEYSAVSGRQATPRSVLPLDHGKAPVVFLPDEAAWLDLFNVFDCDGDGKITKRELEAVLRRLVPDPPTAEEVASMVAEVDRDGDGCISLDEFGALGALLGGGRGGEAELRDAFAVFDADGDGKISAEELLGVFATLGDGGCTLDDCRRMIGGVDTDGDGFVGFDDFVRMMDGQMCH